MLIAKIFFCLFFNKNQFFDHFKLNYEKKFFYPECLNSLDTVTPLKRGFAYNFLSDLGKGSIQELFINTFNFIRVSGPPPATWAVAEWVMLRTVHKPPTYVKTYSLEPKSQLNEFYLDFTSNHFDRKQQSLYFWFFKII